MHKEILSKALSLHQSGDYPQAEKLYLSLVNSDLSPQANYLLGLLYSQNKRFPEAIEHLQIVAPTQQENPDWWNAMALSLQNSGNSKSALDYAKQAVNLNPSHPNYLNRYCNILLDLGKSEQALQEAKHLCTIQPDFSPAYITAGNCLKSQAKDLECAKFLIQSHRRFPANADIAFNLAIALINVSHYSFAEKLLGKLLASGYRCTECKTQLSIIYRERGEYRKSLEHLREALTEAPESALIQWNMGILLLLTKNFTEGWKLYDSGFSAGQRKLPDTNIPRWQGEDLTDKKLLIVGEQGLGDQVMFTTQLKQLLCITTHITLICDERLVPFFQKNFPLIEIIGQSSIYPDRKEKFDRLLMMGSIPVYLSSHGKNIQPGKLAGEFNSKFTTRNKVRNIGIAWKGGTHYKDQLKRKIPLPHWDPILNTRHLEFHCLQHGLDEAEQLYLTNYPQLKLDTKITQNTDLNHLLSKISTLDLVITADNSIAHFAGALGIETWVLIPFSPDWRWGNEGQTCAWYETVRLFRQTRRGHWRESCQSLADYLTLRIQ